LLRNNESTFFDRSDWLLRASQSDDGQTPHIAGCVLCAVENVEDDNRACSVEEAGGRGMRQHVGFA
jgi:hypothetical protein